MKQLRAKDVLASKHVMLIARSLIKLLETFGEKRVRVIEKLGIQ